VLHGNIKNCNTILPLAPKRNPIFCGGRDESKRQENDEIGTNKSTEVKLC
jgi:hypothetical protein